MHRFNFQKPQRDIWMTICLDNLSLNDIYALARSSRRNFIHFQNPDFWNSLLKRDFCLHFDDITQSKNVYYDLCMERDRLIAYTKVFIYGSPDEAVVEQGSALESLLKRPRSRTAKKMDIMKALHAPLAMQDHDRFMRAASRYIKNAHETVISARDKSLSEQYQTLIQASPEETCEFLNDILDGLLINNNNQRKLSPLSSTRQSLTMLSLLSKCGAFRTLEVLLMKMSYCDGLREKFLDCFGASLCSDAVRYHRSNMLERLMLSGVPADAIADYSDYMEDTELLPLASAVKSLGQYYERIATCNAPH
tara:strand:+ start:721 stop:1641 length:921 start_codon:yes stop_codon:yes gene_type:complete